MLELIGGPDRDRTGDLFHAMKCQSPELLKTNSLWAGITGQTGTVGAD
jgi:hypothetical protein